MGLGCLETVGIADFPTVHGMASHESRGSVELVAWPERNSSCHVQTAGLQLPAPHTAAQQFVAARQAAAWHAEELKVPTTQACA
mmetsp:Transcript_6410/g.7278  ORF Transcript_6410/g.7278 Transcript_6410/m.7278 type:complete len:84 (+) Transcript_6410:126-377(+)